MAGSTVGIYGPVGLANESRKAPSTEQEAEFVRVGAGLRARCVWRFLPRVHTHGLGDCSRWIAGACGSRTEEPSDPGCEQDYPGGARMPSRTSGPRPRREMDRGNRIHSPSTRLLENPLSARHSWAVPKREKLDRQLHSCNETGSY